MKLETCNVWSIYPRTVIPTSVFTPKDLEDMFSMMDREMRQLTTSWSSTVDKSWFPYPYNIREVYGYLSSTVEKVVFEFCLAGYDNSEIDVKLSGNLLTVVAEHKNSAEYSGKIPADRYIHRGISGGKCVGNFVIGVDLDTNSMTAAHVNGILTITLNVKKEVVERNTEKKISVT